MAGSERPWRRKSLVLELYMAVDSSRLCPRALWVWPAQVPRALSTCSAVDWQPSMGTVTASYAPTVKHLLTVDYFLLPTLFPTDRMMAALRKYQDFILKSRGSQRIMDYRVNYGSRKHTAPFLRIFGGQDLCRHKVRKFIIKCRKV